MAKASFYSRLGVTPENSDVTPVEPNSSNAIQDSVNAASISEANAEASKDAAAQHAADANTSKQAAQSAQAAADAAKTNAQSSASAASASSVSAANSANVASTQASDAASSAADSLSQAQLSQASASTSATEAANAATSATASETSRVASEAAKVASETAQVASETAEANSATSAANAAVSESNAASSASASASSAAASLASETASAASQVAAAASETNSAASAAAAASSQSAAATSASNSAASASSAATAKTAAEAARDSALSALDSFDDRYLGVKSADPTLDNDGNALVSGSLYFNDQTNSMLVYDGTSWLSAYASLSGALLQTNNLSDLTDTAAARTNLGLGTAATTASTDYAASVHTHTLSSITDAGTAAAAATTDFATAAQGATADAALPKAGGTMTGALNFGDNVKAQFGASSDLQIYHNGGNSIIADVGTGDLYVAGDNLRLTNAALSEVYARGYANGKFSLYYDNVEKLATTSTGIDVTGTVTLDDTLNISGGSTTGFLQASGTSLQLGASTASNLIAYTNNAERMRITSSGSVGIGTSSIDSNAKLAVSNNGAEGLEIRANSTNIELFAYNRSAATYEPIVYNGLSHEWRNSNGNVATIDSSGNVGIGTSSPTYKVDVHGTNPAFRLKGTAGFGYIIDQNTSSSLVSHILYENAAMRFGTNSTERMRIDSSGNLLVGVTSAQTQSGTTAGTSFYGGSNAGLITAGRNGDVLRLNRLSTDGDIAVFRKDGTTVGSIKSRGGNGLVIDSQNNYALGLSYNGSVVTYLSNNLFYPAVDNVVDVGSSGSRFQDAYFSGTVNAANFNTTSDQTLKTNVETLTGSLDAVKALRGVSFDWIDNGNSEVGVIAQEVEAVLPDVVSTNDQGIKSVKYGNMVAVLIEAIKEQQAQIDELKAKLGE